VKRGGFCGVMGPRMSLNTDLEKVFKSYTNQVENIKKKNEHREKLKHGDSYINREICNISGDSNIFNLSGEDCETREELFKKCVNDMLHSSSPDFQKHILYLDCNNLYGSAQCLPMPLNNFQWVEVDMIDRIENFFTKRATDFNRGVPTQSWDSYFGVGEKSTGYFIECDLDFTDKCKNKLIDFPPAPDHMKVSFDELSPFARDAHIKSTGGSTYKENSKLIASFQPKHGYVIHSALADLYSSMGVTFTNVNKVMSFHQETFLKSWVELNTAGRKEAALNKDETLKDFFKLMVNACYGEYS
jgi:hypothetical protein